MRQAASRCRPHGFVEAANEWGRSNAQHPHSYQVWRPQFDQILLDNSSRSGVEVRQGCRVQEVELNGLDRMVAQNLSQRVAYDLRQRLYEHV